jgi:hypothetical protein
MEDCRKGGSDRVRFRMSILRPFACSPHASALPLRLLLLALHEYFARKASRQRRRLKSHSPPPRCLFRKRLRDSARIPYRHCHQTRLPRTRRLRLADEEVSPRALDIASMTRRAYCACVGKFLILDMSKGVAVSWPLERCQFCL